jgi:hypothetical protein
MHSSWGYPDAESQTIRRTKAVARTRFGIKVNTEAMSPDAIFEVAEFISNVHYDVMEFLDL